MKRILALILVVLMLLPFASACGQTDPDEKTPAETMPDPPTKPEDEPASKTEEKASEPETIPQSKNEQSDPGEKMPAEALPDPPIKPEDKPAPETEEKAPEVEKIPQGKNEQSDPDEKTPAETLPDPPTKPEDEPAPETEEKTPEVEKPAEMIPQGDYEKSVTRILIIGNSSSNDVFTLLGRVFNAQGFGGKAYTLSYLYYSGCSFEQHVKFMTNDAPVYDYYKVSNDVAKSKDVETTMKYALEDEQWDVIILHPGGSDDVLHSDLQLEQRRKIEAYVNEHVPTEHVFGFHMRCPNPNDAEIWGPNWPVKAPAGYRERLEAHFNFDPAVQHAKHNEAVKAHILTDPTYKYCISTNAGMFYAQEVLGLAQTALYRDYTHLSDFGRVLASYCFYAQFTGEPLDEVKLDRIPAKNRQKRYQSLGDLILTDDLKHVIKEAANYSLEHPWDNIVK